MCTAWAQKQRGSTHAGWHRHLSAEHGVGAAGGDLQTSQVDDGGGLGLDDDLLGERRVGDVACGWGWLGKAAELKGPRNKSGQQARAQERRASYRSGARGS